MKEFWKVIKVPKCEDPLEIQLEELDFKYCLPKWFWTLTEWTTYHNQRRELVNKIKEELSST